MKSPVRLFLLLVVVLSSHLSAQVGGERDRDSELEGRKRILADLQRARLQFGPFYLVSRVELRNLGYDQELDTPAGEEVDDLSITVAAPQKLFFVPSKKFILSAQYDPAYVWFREQEELRNWNFLVRGDVHLLLNRIYVDVFGTSSKETVRDLAEISRLANRELKVSGVEGEIKFSSKTELLLQTIVSDLDYAAFQDNLQGNELKLEREEILNSFKFRHKTFPRTALSVSADLRNFDFDFSNHRDGDLKAIYVGAERTGSGARLIEEPIQIKIGYGKLDYDDPAEKDYDGPLGLATISFAPRHNLVLIAGAQRQLQFSIFENNNHYAEDTVRLDTTYTIAQRIDLIATLKQGVNRYFIPTFDSTENRAKKRQDQIRFNSIGVKYRLGRNSTVGLGVGYYDRNSNFAGFDEDGIRLFVQLSISP